MCLVGCCQTAFERSVVVLIANPCCDLDAVDKRKYRAPRQELISRLYRHGSGLAIRPATPIAASLISDL
jgi:hypothetical protein